MDKQQILIINGGMRKNGTSSSFTRSLDKIINESGHDFKAVHVIDIVNQKLSIDELKNLMCESDVIGFISPCYVNTLPAIDIWLLEELMNNYNDEFEGKNLFALAQGGMPDNSVHEHILHVFKHFADHTKMNWHGGLIYGLAPLINGADLEKHGRRGKKILSSFELMLSDILNNRKISAQIQKIININIPKFLYPMFAFFLTLSMRIMLKKHDVLNVDARYYLKERK